MSFPLQHNWKTSVNYKSVTWNGSKNRTVKTDLIIQIIFKFILLKLQSQKNAPEHEYKNVSEMLENKTHYG